MLNRLVTLRAIINLYGADAVRANVMEELHDDVDRAMDDEEVSDIADHYLEKM